MMMCMNHFTARQHKASEPGINILYFTDDEGRDWYQSQSLFAGDTLKVGFDDTGTVLCCSYDVSALAPDGMSVAEIRKADLPDGFKLTEPERWQFNGISLVKKVKTQEELQQEAKRQKQVLLDDAARLMAPLQDAADLDMATNEEITTLRAWKEYRVRLHRIDTTKARVFDWPHKPAL